MLDARGPAAGVAIYGADAAFTVRPRPFSRPSGAMAKNLLIVESPAKAKTINKYLGKDFQVLASYGHVRDLVPKEGAVDPEKGFAMRYDLIEKNEKHVAAIAKAAKAAEAIYLATDPDREGEAISWHIAEILRERGLLDGKPLRVTGPRDALEQGISIITHDYVREVPRAKTINYTMGIRLIEEIRRRGARRWPGRSRCRDDVTHRRALRLRPLFEPPDHAIRVVGENEAAELRDADRVIGALLACIRNAEQDQRRAVGMAVEVPLHRHHLGRLVLVGVGAVEVAQHELDRSDDLPEVKRQRVQRHRPVRRFASRWRSASRGRGGRSCRRCRGRSSW